MSLLLIWPILHALSRSPEPEEWCCLTVLSAAVAAWIRRLFAEHFAVEHAVLAFSSLSAIERHLVRFLSSLKKSQQSQRSAELRF